VNSTASNLQFYSPEVNFKPGIIRFVPVARGALIDVSSETLIGYCKKTFERVALIGVPDSTELFPSTSSTARFHSI
jgi:hypothetical protein